MDDISARIAELENEISFFCECESVDGNDYSTQIDSLRVKLYDLRKEQKKIAEFSDKLRKAKSFKTDFKVIGTKSGTVTRTERE